VIEEIDDSVGQVLAALWRLGLERDTLVIFASDNGPWLSYGDHAGSAGPRREGKHLAAPPRRGGRAGSGGRPGRYRQEDVPLALYDLVADIGETTDVAAAPGSDSAGPLPPAGRRGARRDDRRGREGGGLSALPVAACGEKP
jgi:hypothetical protein